MPDINITVTDKRPVCTAGTTVVCDNSDYVVHWDLDEEWSAYDTKTMRVVYMDSTYADIVFSGDSVALPPVTVPGVVQIGLLRRRHPHQPHGAPACVVVRAVCQRCSCQPHA